MLTSSVSPSTFVTLWWDHYIFLSQLLFTITFHGTLAEYDSYKEDDHSEASSVCHRCCLAQCLGRIGKHGLLYDRLQKLLQPVTEGYNCSNFIVPPSDSTKEIDQWDTALFTFFLLFMSHAKWFSTRETFSLFCLVSDVKGGPTEFYSGSWSILYAVREICFYV